MSKTVKNAIDTDKLLDWLVENSVLSIALEGKSVLQNMFECHSYLRYLAHIHKLFLLAGNIDQAQYCERIKGIIELLGSKLSLDELTKIWRIQVKINKHKAIF